MLANNSKDNKLQSHGMTIAQTRDMKEKISAGGKPDMIKCNIKSEFEIMAHESHLIHVTIENKRFNPETGERLSKPYRQCFYVDDFVKMSTVVKTDKTSMKVPENAFAGLEVVILHDPRVKSAAPKQANTDYESMSDKELREEYLAVTGEVADPEDNKAMLIILIKERLQKV